MFCIYMPYVYMPYALLSCSFVTLLYCYCFLNEINGDGDIYIFIHHNAIERTKQKVQQKSTQKITTMEQVTQICI